MVHEKIDYTLVVGCNWIDYTLVVGCNWIGYTLVVGCNWVGYTLVVGNKSAGSFDFGLIPFATYHVDKSGADDPHFDPLVLIWMVKFLFGSKELLVGMRKKGSNNLSDSTWKWYHRFLT